MAAKSKKAAKRKKRSARVFIIGAGVSASCGLPVAQNVLQKAMDMLARHNVPNWDQIHKLLEYLYPSFSVSLRNYPNIEDFMNLIEMALAFNNEDFIASSLWPEGDLKRVKRMVLQTVTDYFWDQMSSCQIEPIRKFVGTCLRKGDTIVTFNWDVTVEQALEMASDFEFWYEPSTDILLLKPHGSIDWFFQDRIPSDTKRAVRRIDDKLCVYPNFTLAKYQKMKKQAPVIVPPVFQKDFTEPFFRKTWRRVYKAVSGATDLFFMGYSLPREDQFARLVLSRALRNNRLRVDQGRKRELRVRVVNPDESSQTTFIRLLGLGHKTHFEFYPTTFDQYVDAVEAGDIHLN
jgi:hypothetical protein